MLNKLELNEKGPLVHGGLLRRRTAIQKDQ